MELVHFGDIAICWCCDILCDVKLLRPNCLADFDKTISCGTVGSKGGVDQFVCSVALVPLSPQVLS